MSKSSPRRLRWPLFAALALLACRREGNDAPIEREVVRPKKTVKDAAPPRRAPRIHRASSTTCAETIEGEGRRPMKTFEPCKLDADCTKLPRGRCATQCVYDDCGGDADCKDGKVCGCHRDGGQGNKCLLVGNCRIDADCGAGAWCSPSSGMSCGNLRGTVGYFCHTAGDECVDDDDCSKEAGLGYCAFNQEVGRWSCSNSVCDG